MLTVVTEDAFFVNTLGGGPHPTGVERAFRGSSRFVVNGPTG